MNKLKLKHSLLNSLSSKIFVSFALLFSLSLFFIIMIEMYGIPNTSVKGYIKKNQTSALQQLNLIADLEKGRLVGWLHERKTLAKVLAENTFLHHGMQDLLANGMINNTQSSHEQSHIRAHLSQIIATHRIYESIAIVNIDSSMILLSTETSTEGQLLKQEKALAALSKLGINENIALIKNTQTQFFDLLIVRKFEAISAANLMIVLRIDTDKIILPLLEIGNMLGQTGDIVIVDNQGQVLFALNHQLADGSYAPTQHIAHTAATGEEGFSLGKDYRNIEVMSAYRHIRITPESAWGLVVKQDYAEIKAPLQKAIYIALFSACLMLFIALLMIYLLTKRLTYPLKMLNNTIKRVQKGCLSERATVYSHDDIGRIGLAFNDMLEEVESQQQQLNQQVKQQHHTIKHSEERIHELAFYDSLTQLPNRTLLIDRLDKSIARAKRNDSFIPILLLNIDNFKSINESVNHHAGDQLLQNIALKLSEVVRNEDSVAHVSGDEFVVLLDDLETKRGAAIKNAESIALKIQHEMSKSLIIQEQEITITISVGIVLFPDDGQTSVDLLKSVDIALYRAKALGRENIQFFAPEMKLIAEQRLAIETGLRHALDNQEFELLYQPQVNVNSGEIIGAEALIRWNHPVEGVVSPIKFIPIAEETHLIIPIGTWVLQSVCQQIKQWENEGYFTANLKTLAANVSAIQFQQDNFVELVSQTVQATGITPSHLEIELTESLFMGDYEKTRTKLNDLKTLGICLTIDDFGTGYSSLSYLKIFPLDVLKIDRSFVMDIVTDPNDAVIVHAIAVMAKALKLTVLAEGVETEQQLNFIQEVGCEVYQGYLYSKPVSSQKITELFKASTSQLPG